MQVKNVLIVDDHAAIIEGYKSIIQYNFPTITFTFFEANTAEQAIELLNSKNHFDLAFIDIQIPSFEKIKDGTDLTVYIKNKFQNLKIIVLTSFTEFIEIKQILAKTQPNAFILKSEFKADEFIKAIQNLFEDKKFYSKTIQEIIENKSSKNVLFDDYNMQIIKLLANGIKTKSLPEQLNLSISAIDKRKSIIKATLGINKGNDEDIIREARKKGLI